MNFRNNNSVRRGFCPLVAMLFALTATLSSFPALTPAKSSAAAFCLSPRLSDNVSVLSEKEFLRLKRRFEKTRKPKDLQTLIYKLNPLLQWALLNGFATQIAISEERPAIGPHKYLSPFMPGFEHRVDTSRMVEIKNGDQTKAEEDFFQRYGHRNFRLLTIYDQPRGTYQTGVEIQTVYPFCCGTAACVVENLLHDTDGLVLYHLRFDSSYDQFERPFAAVLHYATLAIDVKTQTCYYISLTDGQFVNATLPDGKKLQPLFFGYEPTNNPFGILGSQLDKTNYTNPEFLDWFRANGLDKPYMLKFRFQLNLLDKNGLLLKTLHRMGFVPAEFDKLSATQVSGPYSMEDRTRLIEFLPHWLRKKTDAATTLQVELLLSA